MSKFWKVIDTKATTKDNVARVYPVKLFGTRKSKEMALQYAQFMMSNAEEPVEKNYVY